MACHHLFALVPPLPILPQSPALMTFTASLTIIILPDPPETVFSMVFLGINVSSRPVLTVENHPGGSFTYTPKIVA